MFKLSKYIELGKKHCYLVDGSRGRKTDKPEEKKVRKKSQRPNWTKSSPLSSPIRKRGAGQPTGTEECEIRPEIPRIDYKKLRYTCSHLVNNNGYTLEGIIITHPDEDHYGGIQHLLEDPQIDVRCPILLTNKFLVEAEERNEKVKKLLAALEQNHKGRHVDAAENVQGFPEFFEFLYSPRTAGLVRYDYIGSTGESPTPLYKPMENYVDSNSTSIITNVSFPGTSKTLVCLTGDADLKSGIRFLTENKIVVFQVPHHGSKENSSKYLYDNIAPKNPHYYLISCGTNDRFKFPDEETLTHIYEAHKNKKKQATIILTNGKHLDISKIGANVVPQTWRDYISINYWDENIHSEKAVFLEIDVFPCPSSTVDNVIEWSISGYKKMVADLTRKKKKRYDLRYGGESGEKHWDDVEGITGIPSPISPCMALEDNEIILLSKPVDFKDSDNVLVFLHSNSNGYYMIWCRLTPWNFFYISYDEEKNAYHSENYQREPSLFTVMEHQ